MTLFLLIFFSFYANAEEKIQYYTNGNIKTRTNYENGVIDGLQIGYYENGNIKFEASFKNNKLNGITIGYYENGNIKAQDVYIAGILNGEVTAYFENGEMERNEIYNNGKKEGISKVFYDNGQLKSEMFYKNSKVEGIENLYDRNGNLVLKASYKNGELDEILNSTNSNTVGTIDKNITTNNTASNNTTARVNVNKVGSEKNTYIAQCNIYSYKDIARNPSNFRGKYAVFTGKVIQVQESGRRVILRTNVTKGEYGFWSDTIYIDYTRWNDDENRILEDDIIKIYGELNGIKTYDTILGGEASIPWLIGKYIEIK
jgi:antitoxin component YwqK of YwqJK toxin-antitoxin module